MFSQSVAFVIYLYMFPFADEASDFHGIVSSPHMHVLENGSLNIISVQTEDKGRYLCEAANGVGPSLSAAVDLIVHRKSVTRSLHKFITI